MFKNWYFNWATPTNGLLLGIEFDPNVKVQKVEISESHPEGVVKDKDKKIYDILSFGFLIFKISIIINK